MNLRIVAVGRIGRGPEAELFARYAARLRPRPTVIEIGDGSGNPAEIARREAVGLLAAIPGTARAVALDGGGETLDSAALAARITQWRASGRDLAFVIGGAEGAFAGLACLGHGRCIVTGGLSVGAFADALGIARRTVDLIV